MTLAGGSLFQLACLNYLAGLAQAFPCLVAAFPAICAAAAFDLFCRVLRSIR